MKPITNKLLIIFLSLLHLLLGINGLIGGLFLLIKTDGSLLGMKVDWLNRTPFKSYLFPGLLLSVFLGILPLVTFLGLVKKRNWRLLNLFNLYPDKNWAWSFSLCTGIIAITWITIQLILTQYFWIQPVIIFIGLVIIVLTMVPDVIKHFELSHE